MSRSISPKTLPHSVIPSSWQRISHVLVTQHSGLCLYQWLWILFCMIAALAIIAPRVVSQPLVYRAAATTHFDTARYVELYESSGEPSYHLNIALHDATVALRERALARRDIRFGLPNHRVEYELVEPGVIRVVGIAANGAEAQQLADAGAEELVRQIRAAGGREILRNLLGWEIIAALRDEPLVSPFQEHLRDIIAQEAFPMSRPIEPVSAHMSVDQLSRDEQHDVTRALEARYDLWTFEISMHDASLDHACATGNAATTAQRERALLACAAIDPSVQAELDARNRAIERRNAIHGALQFLIDEHATAFRPDAPGAAYRVGAERPADPESRHIALYLLLTVVAGALAGALSVAIDRTAGVMPKVQELWSYRELVHNMVLRDLRARYKSSALGYLWTQLAPLLMMLVFLFVFTQILPSNIALFPVFLIVALLPWNYCAESVSGGVRSVIDNAHLVKKVFFPREVLPLVSVFASLLNYLLSLPMMFLVMAITQWAEIGQLNFSWTIAYLPVLIIIQTMFLIGMVMFLSALAVSVRDTVHLVGILVQFWFFLTPVFYSLDMLGESMARVIRWINPMASIIDFYRDILYGNTVAVGTIPTPGLPALDSVVRVLVTSLIVLALGYWFFQRQSERFGEEL